MAGGDEHVAGAGPVALAVAETADVEVGERDPLNTGPGAFVYVDDPFRGTSAPVYADGSHDTGGGNPGGSLVVTVGGIDDDDINGMSGGFSRQFTLSSATQVTVTFDYNLTISSEYEANEFGEALFSLDGTLFGLGGNDYVDQIVGDGNGGAAQTTGWQTAVIDLGVVSAGTHTMVFGAYNNLKTFNNESTEVRIDNVSVDGPDGTISGPDTAADGSDVDGDGICDAGDVAASQSPDPDAFPDRTPFFAPAPRGR